MPHLLIEYRQTETLEQRMPALMDALTGAYTTSPLIVPENVKMRARGYQHVRVAGVEQDFVHITLSMMTEGSADDRAALSDSLFAALASVLPDIRHITVQLNRTDPATYRKRSSPPDVLQP